MNPGFLPFSLQGASVFSFLGGGVPNPLFSIALLRRVFCSLEVFHLALVMSSGVRTGARRANRLVVYCKVINEKSVLNSEHLIDAFGLKLIMMNIKTQKY